MKFAPPRDMELKFLFDTGLSTIYVAVAVAWSVILFSGCVFLLSNRYLPFIRIRSVPLIVSSVAILHVYWVLCLLAYGLNGFFPCYTEFWIMNIYLPVGIALFHASNAQLLFIATLQQQYINLRPTLTKKDQRMMVSSIRDFLSRMTNPRSVSDVMKCIGVAIIFQGSSSSTQQGSSANGTQLAFTMIIFFSSRRFHPSFGVWGPALSQLSSASAARIQCRCGWEWILSIVWQFFWAWLYAPYLLWKVKGIDDVHGWRTQTICCCVAGLPATPMWLIGIYVLNSTSSKYWIPPLWFSPSILIIEACLILGPCYQVVKSRQLKKETLSIIAAWEHQRDGSSIGTDTTLPASRTSISSKIPSTTSAASSRKAQTHLYTMTALEKALQQNSVPLLVFAALKDFSGENISFLSHVQEWKKGWHRSTLGVCVSLRMPVAQPAAATQVYREQFNRAVEIYSSFVSPEYSNFPVNISSSELKELQAMFETPASLVNYGQNSNPVAPFRDVPDDIETALGEQPGTQSRFSGTREDRLLGRDDRSSRNSVVNTYRMRNLRTKLPISISIPNGFCPEIFDKAADSIKYTVLTNTWPKFVNAGCAAQDDKGSIIDRIQDKCVGHRHGWNRLFS